MHEARITSKLLRFRGVGDRHFYDKQQLTDALKSIHQINQVTGLNNLLKPFRMMGITVNNSLTLSIITTAVSFFSLIITFLASKVTTITPHAISL
jgi:uncharacterized phage infection (PIP) family protein YhgE